jgi:hypothetical protein
MRPCSAAVIHDIQFMWTEVGFTCGMYLYDDRDPLSASTPPPPSLP